MLKLPTSRCDVSMSLAILNGVAPAPIVKAKDHGVVLASHAAQAKHTIMSRLKEGRTEGTVLVRGLGIRKDGHSDKNIEE